jgi:hypothetical protein
MHGQLSSSTVKRLLDRLEEAKSSEEILEAMLISEAAGLARWKDGEWVWLG